MSFEQVYDLYKTIIQNQAKILFEKYNSTINPYNKSKNERELNVVISPENIVNATSSASEKDEIIIYKGLIKRLHDCTTAFLSHSSNAQAPVSDTLTVYMTSISLFYIVSHEFAHIYYGHCEMINNLKHKISVFPFSYQSELPITPLDFQTMEMNADCFAMCETINYVSHSSYHHEEILKLIGDNTITLMLQSISIMFFVLRNMLPPIFNPNFKNSTHHPDFLRQIMNFNTAVKYLNTTYKISLENNIVDEIFAYCETVLSNAYYIPLILDHYVNNSDINMINHETVLRTNWQKIRPEILKYSRMYLPEI